MKRTILIGVVLLGFAPLWGEVIKITEVTREHTIAFVKNAVPLDFKIYEKYSVYDENNGTDELPSYGQLVDSLHLIKIEKQGNDVKLTFAYLWEGEDIYIKTGYYLVPTGEFLKKEETGKSKEGDTEGGLNDKLFALGFQLSPGFGLYLPPVTAFVYSTETELSSLIFSPELPTAFLRLKYSFIGADIGIQYLPVAGSLNLAFNLDFYYSVKRTAAYFIIGGAVALASHKSAYPYRMTGSAEIGYGLVLSFASLVPNKSTMAERFYLDIQLLGGLRFNEARGEPLYDLVYSSQLGVKARVGIGIWIS